MFTSENYHGTVLEADQADQEVLDHGAGVNGKTRTKTRRPAYLEAPVMYEAVEQIDSRPVLAIFCFETGDSVVGRCMGNLAQELAKGQLNVHLFAREGFELENVTVHLVGPTGDGDLVDQVQEFGRRAGNEFLGLFQVGSVPITLLGCEWSSIPVMTLLQGIKNLNILWSLHSLERQRSDLSSDMSRRIADIELAGLRAAKAILVHDPAAAEAAKAWVPECAGRIVNERQVFPIASFSTVADPGQVKARYQIGPVDPTILFIGDLSERYGPDLLVKAMPAVLKNNPQARLIVVGAGNQYWPLRVYTRYLLLEHAVRLVGNVEGKALCELVQAADIIAVPSRETTPWWPFVAAWAARRPVVATHEAAPGILANEEDSVLCYPSENSLVWGIERFLYDAGLGRTLAARGHDKLQGRFGWKNVAAQVENLLGVAAAS